MKFSLGLALSLTLIASDAAFAQQKCTEVAQSDSANLSPKKLFHFDTDSKKMTLDLTKSPLKNKAITAALFKALGLQPLNTILDRLTSDTRDVHFFQKFSDAFGLKITMTPALEEGIKSIPKTGALIIAGNHIMNGTEGIAVLSKVTQVRPDTKLLMTTYLTAVPGLEANAFFLSPYGTEQARIYNERVMEEQILPHLRAGGSIMIYPSGEASKKDTRDSLTSEVAWKKGMAMMMAAVPESKVQLFYSADEASETWYKIRRLAEKAKTGRNRFEKALGKLAWAVIPAFHIREFANNVDREVGFVLSRPYSTEALLKRFTNERGTMQRPGLMQYLQALTFSMRDRMVKNVDTRELQPIWTPADEAAHKTAVTENLIALDNAPLVARGGVNVHLVHSQDTTTPLFTELGRGREIVFRRVGEGSGTPLDLDANDPFYHHFIAYDAKANTLLGSYRMGRLDLLKDQYKRTSYNNTIFEYSRELQVMLDRQGLEFGRSYVDKQAGKKALVAFFALWNRIGQFVAENPHYRYMTGPVSISNTYSLTAKKLIVSYIKKFMMHPKALAKAKVPYTFELNEYEKVIFAKIKSLEDLNEVIKEMDGEEIPPLLGIYSAFKGRYLDFAFDKDFNTVDGMILVDIHEMLGNPELQAVYAKYMGQEGVDAYVKANSGN